MVDDVTLHYLKLNIGAGQHGTPLQMDHTEMCGPSPIAKVGGFLHQVKTACVVKSMVAYPPEPVRWSVSARKVVPHGGGLSCGSGGDLLHTSLLLRPAAQLFHTDIVVRVHELREILPGVVHESGKLRTHERPSAAVLVY